MERYIGLDVHAASCTIAVISQAGKRLKDFPVETNGQALVEAIRMIPGHKHLAIPKRRHAVLMLPPFSAYSIALFFRLISR